MTEYCSGGEMIQYVNKSYSDTGLRINDVSRIAFQLIDAVDHCAKHNVIHRDIKPENIMFLNGKKGPVLRLIDFGSVTIDYLPSSTNVEDSSNGYSHTSNGYIDKPIASRKNCITKEYNK